ncbi:MAG: GatB/YqeY domain-containing protein [Sphingobium sp.]|nr:GatB/YqeY domain-containing protein [Sphingobium sp.]
MAIRDGIKAAQIESMKSGDKGRLAAVRLILAKLKDRDIELRTASQVPEDDTIVVEVLQKMVKQRRESITMYEQGNRPELAAQEQAEIAVIESFLPKQLSEAETSAAIEAIKTELGAAGLKDMGRVMATLKERHGTVLDMSKASALVKAALAG